MGGEWGVAASLVMESVPENQRGLASGFLQSGYPSGYLLASLLYLALPLIGWRGMFMVGIVPALLAFYVRRSVQESPTWQALPESDRTSSIWPVLRQNARLAVFAVIVMMGLNFFAHGATDLYPSEFLGAQHKLSTDTISSIMIVANIGAIAGGIGFGLLSEWIGRKWAIVLAAALTLPVLPFWATATTPFSLAFTAFVLLLLVQGAWGVVPVYLNELSPPAIRGTFPGFVYQAGNFLAAANANIQIWIAGGLGHNFGLAMALTVGVTAVMVAVLMACGRETKGASMGASPASQR
jgi:SHS family lactate transporter-like MFS transporter